MLQEKGNLSCGRWANDADLQYRLDRGGVFGEDDCRLGWQKAQQLGEGGKNLFAQPWSGHLTQFSVFGGGC